MYFKTILLSLFLCYKTYIFKFHSGLYMNITSSEIDLNFGLGIYHKTENKTW